MPSQSSKRLLIIALFTIALILLVNFAWWLFYQNTRDLLDQQLGRRLTAVGSAAAAGLDEATIARITSYNVCYTKLLRQEAVAGRYFLERELGRGGMGIVILARDVALDRLVAIKLLPPELAAIPERRERFLQEARTAAGLSHPNIVPILV